MGSSAAHYSPKLRQVIRRLDALVDWEKSTPPELKRLTRMSSGPAKELLHRLKNPQTHLSAVHITGSKGKGSVAALVTAALKRAPFTITPVGTFASPHVEKMTERVRFDAKEIPDDLLADSLNAAFDARESHPVVLAATWFDVLTASALFAFHRANVQWAVVEVGMGGRLDSTNVLNAPVSVITNIHLEHAHIIGPTIQDIAYEKAGIIAPGASVVCGLSPNDPLAAIFVDEAKSVTPPATIQFCPPQGGSLFEHNLAMARMAVGSVAHIEGRHDLSGEQLLPHSIAQDALASLPARQEMFSVVYNGHSVEVLLDGGHVPESVAQVLSERKGAKQPVIVLGVGREKDVDRICEIILQEATHVFATATDTHSKYLPPESLSKALRGAGGSNVVTIQDPDAAVREAIELANTLETQVVVIGSLHLAGRVRPLLRSLEQNVQKIDASVPTEGG